MKKGRRNALAAGILLSVLALGVVGCGKKESTAVKAEAADTEVNARGKQVQADVSNGQENEAE